jgi:hypothetical protein
LDNAILREVASGNSLAWRSHTGGIEKGMTYESHSCPLVGRHGQARGMGDDGKRLLLFGVRIKPPALWHSLAAHGSPPGNRRHLACTQDTSIE